MTEYMSCEIQIFLTCKLNIKSTRTHIFRNVKQPIALTGMVREFVTHVIG